MKTLLRCALGLLACGAMTAALAEPVSFADLARHARYKMVKISPDGTHIAATTVLANGQTVLSLINLVTKKGANVTPREGDDVQDFWWASSEYVVYNEAEHQGGWDVPIATGELYSVKADGGSPTMLYGYRAGGMQAGSHIQHVTAENGTAEFLSRINDDPKHILATVRSWEGSGSAGGLYTVYRIDVRNGNKTRVADAPMREARYLADHHGNVRFAFGDDLQGNRVIYLRPADGGDWTLLKQASDDFDLPIAFSADDKTAWFHCTGKPIGFGICKFDVTTHAMTHMWSNPHMVATALAQGLASDSVIGVEFIDGRPAVSVFDNKSPAVQALIELMQQYPGEDVHFVSGSDDGSKAIALVEADVDPGTFFLYDKASNAFTPLLQRASWIDPGKLGRADPFTFKTRDGLTEQGYVTYPPGKDGAKNLPMVVFVHGGPEERDNWEYNAYVQAMATRGYAVLQVNYRGSSGYGVDFIKAGWKQWGGKMQDDVTDATRWAIAQGIADPQRICIYGGSYGGYAALEGAVKEPDLYQCAIGYVGVYNLPKMLGRSDAYQTLYSKDFWERTMGTDETSLAQHSPIYQLNNLKAKVMLVVGGRDKVVLPVQGQELHMALLKRGIKHEWLYKPNEWHGFYDEQNIAELFEKVDAFLGANIGTGAGTGVAKAPQAGAH